MTNTLNGKVALVTGASRGIGAAIAQRLAADGASVALTYSHSKDRAEEVVAGIRSAGGRAHAIQADSARDEDIAAAVDETVRALGGLDILVNNAGGGTFGPVQELPLDAIDTMINVNIRGVVVGIREALRHLPDGGRIITIGSINADRIPFPGGSVYGMTKSAVAGLTRGLARELGPRAITVNNVQPGPTDTDANPADGPMSSSMLGWMALDRFGRSEEIAAMVSYLAGPEAGFVTGASLDIDGGFGA
ncbi:oxidoreductase [Streptomyces natalensis ATCC 27448]|uniref:Oxidoreductase n=1 Tax=Streptomyces natalensis ATCC 27448 TaxID=1240678 RepID=A0A0D7CMI8_9ACTN|nr:SDR family oxidoreductase [Streptomyces natalensis]KIZ17080.1 oxidoreductase [Streptomyces natalensis ATCC 27448]